MNEATQKLIIALKALVVKIDKKELVSPVEIINELADIITLFEKVSATDAASLDEKVDFLVAMSAKILSIEVGDQINDFIVPGELLLNKWRLAKRAADKKRRGKKLPDEGDGGTNESASGAGFTF